MEKKTKKKGVFVPEEILKDKRLTANDKFLLSYYRYCTERMEKHCCIQTNGDVAEFLGMSEKTFERSKHHLKELGLIDTDGGIKTWSVTKGYPQNDGGGYRQNDGGGTVKMGVHRNKEKQ